MDYFSNILKKSSFKSETGEEKEKKEDENSASESDKKQESTGAGIKAGFVDGVSNIFKSTFKGDNSENDENKEATAETGEPKRKESLIGSGFIANVWKSGLFKSDTNEAKRKSSTDENIETETKEENPEESGEKLSPTEPVSQKAFDSAKSIGNFLYSVANKAGQTVSATAKQLKQTVEQNSLLVDFTKEQQEFIKEHGGNIQVGEPPWIGCEDEEEVKKQIISLSQDKRNFVRSPPSGVPFEFDMQHMLPVALALLKHDPNLEKMRFEIVPKLVNEEAFWRNYFYRVSLIKQSTSLSNMNKGCRGWASSSSSSAEGPDEPSPTNPEAEFVSDSIQGVVSEEDLQKGMRQLGVDKRQDSGKDDKHWEEEITKDLQEFEVVSSDINNIVDEDLEKELAQL